jgi:tetratricopeptide (TPR) repeat protein
MGFHLIAVYFYQTGFLSLRTTLMKQQQRILFLMLCMFAGIGSFGQNVSDTLNLAKKLREKGKIHQSFKLLKKAYSHHPDNLNVAWLTAQTAFWANKISKSKQIYRKAIKDNLKNMYLKLDYSKMLVNTGDFLEATDLLKNYLSYDSTNAQALTALSRISFWECRYNDATKKVRKALKSDPKFPDALSLEKEIAIARSPYLKIGAGYITDDQPMTTISTLIAAGFYFHPLSSVHFNLQTPFMIRDGQTLNAFLFDAGNVSCFSSAGLTIGIDAGVGRFPFKAIYMGTGNLTLDEICLRHLEISVLAERNPYFLTRSSIDTVVIQNHLKGSIGWNNLNNWNGQIAVEAFTYPIDKNLTYSAYGWIFAPPVKFSVFRLGFGYAYNYSSSQKNRYLPEKSLSEIIANWESNQSIAGIYNPYYTPKDQQFHSFLLSFSGHLLKWLDFSLSTNTAILASAQVPYLYLDKNSDGNTILKTGFASQNFTPVTIHGQLNIKASDRISLQTEYAFMRTFYYTSNYVGIGLTLRFPNDKKN